jgi:RNA recognition motif-containing protein
MEKKLYVGNLSFSATEKELEDLFAQAGSVASVAVITDRNSGRSKGFAFVEMSTPEEAEEAIGKFNEYEFMGRPLKVSVARPKEDRGNRDQRRGGGRGGYRGGENRERNWNEPKYDD